MRPLISSLLVLAFASFSLAQSKGKTHDFKTADGLPKSIAAKVGDTIVIREAVGPRDVEDFSVKSDHPNVKLESQTINGVVHIVIQCPKKAEAKVGWRIETRTGAVIEHKDLKIKIE